MPYSYQNRFGKTWRLFQRFGSSGKLKFYFSAKDGGEPAPALPHGYEVFENVRGQPFLRKAGTAEIRQAELDQVTEALRRHGKAAHFEAWPDKKTVTLYEISRSMGTFSEALGLRLSREQIEQADFKHGYRQALLRFVLADKNSRLFVAERYCFRGSVDDWIFLNGPDRLEPLCREFIPHLGKDSLFELF